MDKTSLVDLKRKIFIRSALISLDSLDELLGLNNYLSGDEVLLEIIKKALREFELTEPLILEMPVNYQQLCCSCLGRPGWGELKSNFSLYLKCILPEHRIILVPTSLPMWRVGEYAGNSFNGYYSGSSVPSPGAYQYFTDYQKPYIYIGDIGMYQGTGDIYIKGICNRPIVPDFLPDKTFNPVSELAAVYWLDVETGGAKGNYFLDLCLVHLLDYIRQLKASISLPNMPVDVLSNVDSAYQEYRARCDQYSLQSGWRGELLL